MISIWFYENDILIICFEFVHLASQRGRHLALLVNYENWINLVSE